MPLHKHVNQHTRDGIGSDAVQVIAVTGGKGGTGKTTVAVNLATALAQAGRHVLLLDGDLGLANVDVLLGLTPTLHARTCAQRRARGSRRSCLRHGRGRARGAGRLRRRAHGAARARRANAAIVRGIRRIARQPLNSS